MSCYKCLHCLNVLRVRFSSANNLVSRHTNLLTDWLTSGSRPCCVQWGDDASVSWYPVDSLQTPSVPLHSSTLRSRQRQHRRSTTAARVWTMREGRSQEKWRDDLPQLLNLLPGYLGSKREATWRLNNAYYISLFTIIMVAEKEKKLQPKAKNASNTQQT